MYRAIYRSDKYIIFRFITNTNDLYEVYIEGESENSRLIRERNTFLAGDLRVSFYQSIQSEEVHFLA